MGRRDRVVGSTRRTLRATVVSSRAGRRLVMAGRTSRRRTPRVSSTDNTRLADANPASRRACVLPKPTHPPIGSILTAPPTAWQASLGLQIGAHRPSRPTKSAVGTAQHQDPQASAFWWVQPNTKPHRRQPSGGYSPTPSPTGVSLLVGTAQHQGPQAAALRVLQGFRFALSPPPTSSGGSDRRHPPLPRRAARGPGRHQRDGRRVHREVGRHTP
jgi:hypothetical protein